jgi:hypothetical protein
MFISDLSLRQEDTRSRETLLPWSIPSALPGRQDKLTPGLDISSAVLQTGETSVLDALNAHGTGVYYAKTGQIKVSVCLIRDGNNLRQTAGCGKTGESTRKTK